MSTVQQYGETYMHGGIGYVRLPNCHVGIAIDWARPFSGIVESFVDPGIGWWELRLVGDEQTYLVHMNWFEAEFERMASGRSVLVGYKNPPLRAGEEVEGLIDMHKDADKFYLIRRKTKPMNVEEIAA